MGEMHTVTLPSDTYKRVEQLARTRQQSVEEIIDEITSQPSQHIERRPGVQGGDACIAGTRIPVWVLAAMHKQGDTVEDVLEAYPDLSAAQVHAAFSYYYDHRAEIDAVIATQNIRHAKTRGNNS
ncbi:MAG TPA: DUF433 domain-containing protein [Anaerolineae bacterium]|nr:DUF433 domain-containing protein [Anaerolineae bacterium]